MQLHSPNVSILSLHTGLIRASVHFYSALEPPMWGVTRLDFRLDRTIGLNNTIYITLCSLYGYIQVPNQPQATLK